MIIAVICGLTSARLRAAIRLEASRCAVHVSPGSRIPEPKQMMLWLAESRDRAPIVGFLRDKCERENRADVLRAKLGGKFVIRC